MSYTYTPAELHFIEKLRVASSTEEKLAFTRALHALPGITEVNKKRYEERINEYLQIIKDSIKSKIVVVHEHPFIHGYEFHGPHILVNGAFGYPPHVIYAPGVYFGNP